MGRLNPLYRALERPSALRALTHRWECLRPSLVISYRRIRNGVLVPNRRRLYAPSNGSRPFFFAIGAPRSGNTLLRAMLSSHPRVCIPPESYFLATATKVFRSLPRKSWNDVVDRVLYSFECPQFVETWRIDLDRVRRRAWDLAGEHRTCRDVLLALYAEYAESVKPGADVWGDKTPQNTLNLPWIHMVWPDAKFIWLLRDGRDAVASYVNSGLTRLGLDNACALWRRSNRAASGFCGDIGGAQCQVLRYEALVSEPRGCMERMSSFLGVEFSAAMLDFSGGAGSLGDVPQFAHHANVMKDLTADSVGKWRRTLSPGDQRRVQELLKPDLQEFGYAE